MDSDDLIEAMRNALERMSQPQPKKGACYFPKWVFDNPEYRAAAEDISRRLGFTHIEQVKFIEENDGRA